MPEAISRLPRVRSSDATSIKVKLGMSDLTNWESSCFLNRTIGKVTTIVTRAFTNTRIKGEVLVRIFSSKVYDNPQVIDASKEYSIPRWFFMIYWASLVSWRKRVISSVKIRTRL